MIILGTHCLSTLCKIGQAIFHWLLCRIEKVPVFGKDLNMNDSNLGQRVNIQPSAKLKKYANKTFNMLKDFYNDKEMSRTKLFDRYNKFRESRKDELDDW